jgi:hypothetical protein
MDARVKPGHDVENAASPVIKNAPSPPPLVF